MRSSRRFAIDRSVAANESRSGLDSAVSQLKLSSVLNRVRRELRRVADPRKAAGAQAYMKSAMPYHGVPVPALRQACKRLFAEIELPSREVWRGHVLELWRGARYREERYVAIEMTGDKRARAFQTPVEMPLYEEIIVTGAWWDFVDGVASHRVGPILRDYPAPMKKKMLVWSRSANMWKRRTAIICQLGFKQRTDLDLRERRDQAAARARLRRQRPRGAARLRT